MIENGEFDAIIDVRRWDDIDYEWNGVVYDLPGFGTAHIEGAVNVPELGKLTTR